MKINLPTIEKEVTGFRTGFIETYDADMRLVDSTDIDVVMTKPVLSSVTVFDYDFQSARRAIAAGRLTWKLFAAVVILPPVLGVLMVLRVLAGVAAEAYDELRYRFRELRDDVVDTHRLIVAAVKRELAEIAAR